MVSLGPQGEEGVLRRIKIMKSLALARRRGAVAADLDDRQGELGDASLLQAELPDG